MKNYVIIAYLLVCISASGQNWRDLEFNKHQYGLEQNPLKGFATMWDVHSSFPYSIQGKLFKFSDIVVGDSVYDWTVVDQFIASEAAKGKHVYLQVNIDPVKDALLDLPQYILDSLATNQTTPGLSDIVYLDEVQADGSIKTLVSPNWNNPTLMKAMLDFTHTFGVKYNSDPAVFMVHTGLYGMWGEWHVFPFEDTLPHVEMSIANKTLIADAFTTSFPDTKILARYPVSMPDPTKFGYSDGLVFEHSIGTPHWYFNNLLINDGASENWKNHPIGGEVSPELQDTILEQWPNITGDNLQFLDGSVHSVQDITASINTTHSSWLFMHYLFRNPSESGISQTEINNALRVQRDLGYNFYMKNYKLAATDSIVTVSMGFKNKGIAPMYANWDVEIAVLDSSDSLISLQTQKLDLDDILPSHYVVVKHMTASLALNDGDYTVLVRIKNPLAAHSNNAPPVRFANETQDLHRTGWLSLGEMTLQNGAVSNVSDATANGPFGGVNSIIPGSIEGEHFNNGGLGVAYNEDAVRQGYQQFRPSELVDIVAKTDASNGYVVGYTNTGEWLDYTVDISETRRYNITLKYYSKGVPGDLKISLDGTELTTISGIQSQPNWNTAATITVENVSIPAGSDKLLRLEFVNGAKFDIDALKFSPSPFIIDGTYTLKSKSDAYIKPSDDITKLENVSNAMGDTTKWTFTHLGDDVYRIESALHPDRRVEVPFGNCGQRELVGLTTYTGPEDHLKWKVTEEGNYLMFSPLHCLGYALDAWANNIDTVHLWWKNTNNNNQLFELIDTPSNSALKLGTATLSNASSSMANTDISVYPNPVSETLNIRVEMQSDEPSDISIFNLQGQLLYQQKTSQNLTVIDANSLNASGILLVKVTNDTSSQLFKIVKQ